MEGAGEHDVMKDDSMLLEGMKPLKFTKPHESTKLDRVPRPGRNTQHDRENRPERRTRPKISDKPGGQINPETNISPGRHQEGSRETKPRKGESQTSTQNLPYSRTEVPLRRKRNGLTSHVLQHVRADAVNNITSGSGLFRGRSDEILPDHFTPLQRFQVRAITFAVNM